MKFISQYLTSPIWVGSLILFEAVLPRKPTKIGMKALKRD
jgi:hypothetical protein